ncbi:unnamed protein product [Zymoseptoria tritici ST99CH_1A5]|nr:unnamed protein product [Zymoseptoria tritici ST99CH_1A5]
MPTVKTEDADMDAVRSPTDKFQHRPSLRQAAPHERDRNRTTPRSPPDMADGMNNVRAIRIAELMKDFHDIQKHLADVALPSAAETSTEEGFALMRQCKAQARALLRQPFEQNGKPSKDEEKIKMQLKRIIVDAAVRRFRAWKIYMYLNAALRWAHAREIYLMGERPEERHAPDLSELQERLRMEIASITDVRVEAECRRKDAAEGRWLVEDPPASFISTYTGTQR